jgi:predicted extracellular nuclease
MCRFVGDEAYSYVFDGRQGYLDHALATATMTNQSVNAYEWHINAAEPPVFDYNTEFKSANQITEWYTPSPVRFSDHDPVFVDLALSSAGQLLQYHAWIKLTAETKYH